MTSHVLRIEQAREKLKTAIERLIQLARSSDAPITIHDDVFNDLLAAVRSQEEAMNLPVHIADCGRCDTCGGGANAFGHDPTLHQHHRYLPPCQSFTANSAAKEQRAFEADLVLKAAQVWWENHRPGAWTLEQHLEHPAVNAYNTRSSEQLAIAVAAYLSSSSSEGTK